jgi:hypothetical protein
MTARGAGWLTPSIQKSRERSETFGLSAATGPDYDVLLLHFIPFSCR